MHFKAFLATLEASSLSFVEESFEIGWILKGVSARKAVDATKKHSPGTTRVEFRVSYNKVRFVRPSIETEKDPIALPFQVECYLNLLFFWEFEIVSSIGSSDYEFRDLAQASVMLVKQRCLQTFEIWIPTVPLSSASFELLLSHSLDSSLSFLE